MIFDTKVFIVALLSSMVHPTFGQQQYTPDIADWSTFQEKVPGGNHAPDAISWLDEDNWKAWDGTVIDPTIYSKVEFARKICPSGDTVLGMYELFYETKPFADNTNPTKAEVDEWHRVVLKHIRALVGYDESEYRIIPDECLHVRALFSQERHRTKIWDTKYPEGTCEGSTNAHCGASFLPSIEDQQNLEGYLEYLPIDQDYCTAKSGSEGISGAGKASIPWSIKWARPFCTFLADEGFWGGHVGPFFLRERFGWSWRDTDVNDQNSNTQVRLKWGGEQYSHKYENPLTDKLRINVTEPFGVSPDATYESYECIVPNDFETYFTTATDATDCYRQVMAEDTCGKRFLTFGENENSDGKFGCACYPPEMESCDTIQRPKRRTWDFRPISYSFGGLSVDITKSFTTSGRDALPWNGRQCPNARYVTNAASISQCLEKLVEADFKFCVDGYQFDCERNLMTWNEGANSGANECACYPLNSQICKRADSESRSGRKTYAIESDPSFIPNASTTPPKTLNCPTRPPTLSLMPSATPSLSSQSPSDTFLYFDGYYVNTQERKSTFITSPMPWGNLVCPGEKSYFRGYPDVRNCVEYLVENNFELEYRGNPFPCSKEFLSYIPSKSECVFYREGTLNCDDTNIIDRRAGRETYEIRFDPSTISVTPTALPTSQPTKSPTNQPTFSPTKLPTASPTTTPTFLPTTEPTSSPTKFPTKLPTRSPSVSSPTTSVQLYDFSTFETGKGKLWKFGTYNEGEEAIDLTSESGKKKKIQTQKNTIPTPSEIGYKTLQVKLDVEYISPEEYQGVKLQLDVSGLRVGNKKKRKTFKLNEFNDGPVVLEHEFSMFEAQDKSPWLKVTLQGKKGADGKLSHKMIVRSVEINFLF